MQSYLVLSIKKNLDVVFSMDDDFVQVLHPCKSVAHLASWICNIYIYWKFGVGNIEDVERGAELCFSGPLPLRGPLTSASASRTPHVRFADPASSAELSFSGPLRGPLTSSNFVFKRPNRRRRTWGRT